MLSVNQTWGALNAARIRERRWYLVIEPNPGTSDDDFYIKSHADIDLTGLDGTVIASKIISAQTSSQHLNPDEGRATIGSMTIQALDVSESLTDEMRTQYLTNNRGLRGKRVSLYSGFAQITDVDDYVLIDTQIIDLTSYKLGGVWTIRCRDIQREARKEIFEPIVMNLAQPLDATSTTIEVVNIPTSFDPVEHGTSYVDAPSATVAYIKIDDEIIRVPTAGIGTTQFTTVVRGVLGTRAAEHTTDEDAGSERGKKITEVVYLEMPIPKMAYALLTGVLLGQSGTLPAHWHAGIEAGPWVATSEFQNIGVDLYDATDDTAGTIEKYVITESVDAKAFIERQLYRKYGLFSPIHSDGQLGLKRGQPVLTGSATIGVINDSHIIDRSLSVTYNMTKVINDIEVAWNEINGEPSRRLRIQDANSISAWGAAPKLEVIAKGLVGARHTESTVRDLYEGLRDRYSGPPLTASVKCHASQCLYEVGDVIRLQTSFIRDFTNSSTNDLDRAVEVQGVRRDLMKGYITYDVFGSTQKAGPLPPIESTAALADGFYTAVGTDIAGMGGVVDAGSELQLPNGLQFTGHADITNASAIYYATKDVRIEAGNVVTYTQNVQLRIRGVLQIDGDLDGSEAGLSGVADTVDVSSIPHWGDGYINIPMPFVTQPGVPGYFGSTQGNGGLIERMRRRSGSSSRHRVNIQSLPASITQGAVEAVPSYNLQVPDGGASIVGLPTDLRGTSGGPGALRYWNRENAGLGDEEEVNRGGTGGDGGAGLLIVSRGALFGGSGRIVTSGEDGGPAVRNAGNVFPAWSGSGAGGAPGAVIFVLDGAGVSSPVLTDGTIIADYGASPPPGSPNNVVPSAWIEYQDTRIGVPEISGAFVRADRASLDVSAASGREAGIAAARIFFLLPYVTPEEDTDDVALADAQDISLGVTEAFGNRLDTRVTLLIATITENDVTSAYSHANIYVRGSSAGALYPDWFFVGGAEPTLEFELPADGETYDVRAVPVLINGIESAGGVEQVQVTTDGGTVPSITSYIAPAGNLISDPNFQRTLDEGFGATLFWTKTTDVTVEAAGENSNAIITFDSADGDEEITGTVFIPVVPGEVLYFAWRFKEDASYTGEVRFSVARYDIAKSFLGNTTVDGSDSAAQGSWITEDGEYAVPTDTHWLKIRLTQRNAGGLNEAHCAWMWLSRSQYLATVGSQLGVNTLNEAGAILGDSDLRNDLNAQDALSALNANPTFYHFADRNGVRGPASWILVGASAWPTYVDDETRDEIRKTGGTAGLVGAAMFPEPNTKYEFSVLIKMATTTSDIVVVAHEYDSALPTGKRYISSSTQATTKAIVRNRAVVVVAATSVGTGYQLLTGTYTPTSTAVAFSPGLSANGSANDWIVEYFIVRDKATWGSQLGVDFKDESGNPLADVDVRNDYVAPAGNLVSDPNFQRTLDAGFGPYWVKSATVAVVADGENSNAVIRFASTSGDQHVEGTIFIPVVPGEVLYLAWRFMEETGYDGELRFSVARYDIGQVFIANVAIQDSNSAPVDVWTTKKGEYTVPTDTHWIKMRLTQRNAGGSDEARCAWMWLSRFQYNATLGAPSGTPVGGLGDADYVSNTIEGEGTLAEGVSSSDGTTFRAISHGLAIGSANDGDAVDFTDDMSISDWDNLPAIIFAAGGVVFKNSGLTGDQWQNYRAVNLSVSGFTASLKVSETVGSGTARTDSTVSTPGSPSGVDHSINKGQTDEAYNDQYTFQFDAFIKNLFIGEPGYSAGSMTVGLYTNDGAGWVQRATVLLTGIASDGDTTTRSNVTRTLTVDGLGLNDDFGISIESESVAGGALVFDEVRYTTASAPTEVSATPSGVDPVKFFVLGGQT